MKTLLLAVLLVMISVHIGVATPLPGVEEVVRQAREARTPDDAVRLLRTYDALDRQEKYADLDAIHDALRDGAADPYGRPCLQYFYAMLRNRTSKLRPTEAIEVRQKWAQAQPNSVAARVLIAESWLDYAQEGRGNGPALTVSVDNVRVMFDRAKKAIALLDDAAASPQVDAQVHASLVRAARYYDWPLDKTDEAFTAAVKLDKRYSPAYQQMAMYLLPRWYGKAGALGSFVRRTIKIRGDNVGCADVASVAYPFEGKQLFSYDGVSWSVVKAGFEEKLRSLPPQSPSLIEALNCMAALACLADDGATARAAFETLGPHADAAYFQTIGSLQKWQSWAQGAR